MKNILSLFAAVLVLGTCLGGVALAAEDEGSSKGIKMGAALCPGSEFDCNQLGSMSSKLPELANICVHQQMNVDKDIFNGSSGSGAGENCMRSEEFTNQSNFKSWIVCCVKRSESGDACFLACTPYIQSRK